MGDRTKAEIGMEAMGHGIADNGGWDQSRDQIRLGESCESCDLNHLEQDEIGRSCR